MPFYEYRCDACGHEDSFLEGINAPQKKTCPKCKKRRAFQRLVSAAGFQLKGDGWYVTDFKDKDKPKAKPKKEGEGGGDDKPADKKADAKGETTTDSKTDKKADAKSDSKPTDKPKAKPDK